MSVRAQDVGVGTVGQLRALYAGEKAEREKRSDYCTWLIYRPLSFQITPLFLRAGLSAMAVTWLGFALAALMPVVALTMPEQAYLWMAALSFGWMVLDCVDGNIARLTGTTSRVGQYVDSLIGRFHYLFLNTGVAIVAAHQIPAIAPGWWLCMALAASLLRVWSRESRAYYKINFADRDFSFAKSEAFGWKNVLAATPKMVPLGLLLAGSIGMVHVILWVFLVLDTAIFVHTQRGIIARLSR